MAAVCRENFTGSQSRAATTLIPAHRFNDMLRHCMIWAALRLDHGVVAKTMPGCVVVRMALAHISRGGSGGERRGRLLSKDAARHNGARHCKGRNGVAATRWHGFVVC